MVATTAPAVLSDNRADQASAALAEGIAGSELAKAKLEVGLML
jgi:hypothetical protein